MSKEIPYFVEMAEVFADHIGEEIIDSSPEGMGCYVHLDKNHDITLEGCRFEDDQVIVTFKMDFGLGQLRELVLKPVGWRKPCEMATKSS